MNYANTDFHEICNKNPADWLIHMYEKDLLYWYHLIKSWNQNYVLGTIDKNISTVSTH